MDERYRLTRLFSRGGMAELYLGTAAGAEGFEKRVAIKRILPHLAEDPEVARMFVAEAKLATYLNHQNIIQIFDVGRGPDGLFIVMELVDGWDLGVIIDQAGKQNRPIPASLAWRHSIRRSPELSKARWPTPPRRSFEASPLPQRAISSRSEWSSTRCSAAGIRSGILKMRCRTSSRS